MRNACVVGERVYLRPIEVEDAPLLQKWINDPEVNRYLGVYLPCNEAREREWVQGLYRDLNGIVLLIVLREGDRPIGNCGFHAVHVPNRSAELGILIGEEEFQGRGYGAEAMRLLCGYGFNRLNLHRIGLRVYAYNRRAIRCYEKVGFRHEGAQREARFLDGRWHEILMMGILEQEFRGSAGVPAALTCQENPS